NGSASEGSITAFYTVLAEGDDQNDPIVDAARAILDGHIVLSRQLADSGLYPAIDIESSVSRAMTQITNESHQALITRFRSIYSTYQEHRDLVAVGAYQRGSDKRVDEAIQRWPAMLEFLRQGERQRVNFASSVTALRTLLDGAPVEASSPPETGGGHEAARGTHAQGLPARGNGRETAVPGDGQFAAQPGRRDKPARGAESVSPELRSPVPGRRVQQHAMERLPELPAAARRGGRDTDAGRNGRPAETRCSSLALDDEAPQGG